MKLPKYHETFTPILKVLSAEEYLSRKELRRRVVEQYYSNLSNDLLSKKTRSGTNVLFDRIGWGKSYLRMGKFVDYPKRGLVGITEKGKAALATGDFNLEKLKNDQDYIDHLENRKSKKDKETVEVNVESASPQDLIDSGFTTIETQVKEELLERLKGIDPYYFEKVILILLKKMGYGDFVETSKSGDGGIDGIINEDKLGLEKIYTQAKRYSEAKVREKDIRNFIGAMSGDTGKGVFITTSTFDKSAVKKARDAHHAIVLIDGNKLVELMLQYNVGIQIKTTYEVKELDDDFFDEE